MRYCYCNIDTFNADYIEKNYVPGFGAYTLHTLTDEDFKYYNITVVHGGEDFSGTYGDLTMAISKNCTQYFYHNYAVIKDGGKDTIISDYKSILLSYPPSNSQVQSWINELMPFYYIFNKKKLVTNTTNTTIAKDRLINTAISTTTGFYIERWQRPNGTVYTKTHPISAVPGLSIYNWQASTNNDRRVIANGYWGSSSNNNRNTHYLRKPVPEPRPTCSLNVKSVVGNGIIIQPHTNKVGNESLYIDGKNIGSELSNYIPTIYHPSIEGSYIVTLRAYSSKGSCSRSATVSTHRLNLMPGEMISYGVTDYTGYEGFSRLPFTSFRDFVPMANGKDIYSLSYKKDMDNGGTDDQLVYQKYNLDTGSQTEISYCSIPYTLYYTSGMVYTDTYGSVYALKKEETDIYGADDSGVYRTKQNTSVIDASDYSMFWYSPDCKSVASMGGWSYSSDEIIFTARDEKKLYLITTDGLVIVDKTPTQWEYASSESSEFTEDYAYKIVPLNIENSFFQNIFFTDDYTESKYPLQYGVVDGDSIYIPDTQTNQYIYKIHKETGEVQKFSLPEPYGTVENATWFYVYNDVLFYSAGFDYIDPNISHETPYNTSIRFKFLDVKDMSLKQEYRLDLASNESWRLYGVAKTDTGIVIDYFKGWIPE